MDKKQTNVKKSVLKFLKWLFLILLILVGSFAIFYGVSMHNMQAGQIAEVLKYIDTGDIIGIDRVVRKNMVLTHYFLFYSFIASVCCLTMIIILLYISLLNAKRKIKLQYNQAFESGVKDNATGGSK